MKILHLSLAAALALASSFAFAAPVNINTAPASEIARALSGVGQSKAEAIVNFRNKHGKFKKADDIVQVKGIGNATYEKNKADILVK